MAQHIQLQKVFLHGVVFKMGGDLVGVGIVGGMLHRAEIPNLILLGDDHQAAGMLAGGTPYPHAARGQSGLLGPVGGFPPLG